jgi:nitrogen fixation protein FixH
MREITGRDVLLVIGGGFAVVIAVNAVLAISAVRTFPGLEVKNSYVASQAFDAERASQDALGWTTSLDHRDGRLVLHIEDADGPVEAEIVSAVIGRTTHVADDVLPDFVWTGAGYAAPVDLAPGIWAMRLEARAEDGTRYRRRLEIRVSP